ncbi:MAG: D-glycerate dehydrogenase [Firmicutes bacterium]|jgi:glyoxylate reductase|nr:D-glycerate dehydrogenase [Bacillota bacterium]HQD39782.1 D-glycerate dehydrogenase [Bacillota bacterium]
MWKVFVTRRIPEPGLEMLREKCEVEVNPEDRVLTKEEIIEGVKGKDALLCLLTDDIDEEIMDANPNLKVISNYAVGFNNIKVEEATKRGLPVTNTPGVLTETTADMAWALLMAVGRRIVESDKFTRAGKFKGWGPMLLLGYDIYGKTLGLVGLGRIGEAMVKRAHGFDMKVLYYDANRRSPEDEKELGIEYRELDQLLAESDYVSLHVPLLPSTHHLIGERELGLMKKTGILINTARGPVVDEKALVKALQDGEIAGAGLDVYENEPALEPGLIDLDNVVLAPHTASATRETRTKMATMAAENLLAALEGKIPPNIVNPEVYNK